MFLRVCVSVDAVDNYEDPLCSLVAATDIESIESIWSCGTDGQPATPPCTGLVVWTGLTCSIITNVPIGIDIDSNILVQFLQSLGL